MRTREIKAAVTVPWFEDEGILSVLGNKVTKEPDAYSKISLIYRAVRLRCNTLTKVPVYVYRGRYDHGNPLERYQFEDTLPLRDLLWLTEASVLLRGAGWVLKNSNEYGFKRGLQWLNPFTVKMEMVGGELRFWQEMPDGTRFPKAKGYWTIEDFLYYRDFNPLDDVGPGVSATSVAMTDGNTLYSVSKFLSNFFTADALPITMVTMPSGVNPAERERVESWFKNKITKMRNAAARVLGVSGEVKLERLTSELNTFDFDKIDTHSIQSIAWAFDIPKTVLTADSANRSTAETEYKGFIEDTIVPRCKYHEQIINSYLEEFNQRIEFAPEEMSVMQENEASRAQSLSQLTSAGVPLRAALDILGYDLSEEAEAELDKAEAEKEKNKKVMEEKLKQAKDNPEDPPVDETDEEVKTELDKWMRKSLNRLRKGDGALTDFESEKIPNEIKAGVEEALKLSTTEDQVKAVFKKATEV